MQVSVQFFFITCTISAGNMLVPMRSWVDSSESRSWTQSAESVDILSFNEPTYPSLPHHLFMTNERPLLEEQLALKNMLESYTFAVLCLRFLRLVAWSLNIIWGHVNPSGAEEEVALNAKIGI